MSSCERPLNRSASDTVPSSVSKRYSLSIRTQGSSCRRRASSSLRRVSSFSASSSSSRAASHSSRVPVMCFVISMSLSLFLSMSLSLFLPRSLLTTSAAMRQRLRSVSLSDFVPPRTYLSPAALTLAVLDTDSLAKPGTCWVSHLTQGQSPYNRERTTTRANSYTFHQSNSMSVGYIDAMEFHVSLIDRKDLSGEIYRQIRRAIVDGRLRPGEFLPPSRELARRLSVARTTVTVAYERLASEGFVSSRVGAGTFVNEHVAHSPDETKRRLADGPLGLRPIWDSI